MESEKFAVAGRQMIDYVIQYLENIRDRRVFPTVKPGFMRELIPADAPDKGESWEAVFNDIERVIMPGVTHWHSPRFNAFFPTANSYPAILADILSDAIGCVGFTWAASPSCTELEVVMMDWLGKMLKLPNEFLSCGGGLGGGVIQGTASEATVVALLAAKSRAVKKIKEDHPGFTDMDILSKLMCYASDQAHSSVERAAMLGALNIRLIKSNDDFSMNASLLEETIKQDKANGLFPFYVVATLGTTPCCAFDNLMEIGPICQRESVWLHVDAAYAGSAFICPEFRHYMDGVELADSFNFNPHKWMLVNFDCSAMWVKNSPELVEAFNVDPLYLRHDKQGLVPDYRHWQIPLGRRFRSLKLWFVMRMYGVEGIQRQIREQVALAKEFEQLLASDHRFELAVPVRMGLTCFRLKGPNELNEKLLRRINESGKIYLTPSKLRDKFIIRCCVCASRTTSNDIEYSWTVIKEFADQILEEQRVGSKAER
ncbi:aromatic-L-amino-acid decarboxylase-like [Paramacrobiotus metropolitanus]|uniref:aromatic-L-amino-acid decarboxylase-like n=1 Tax=Paramacrobiotus metropolitanus TaxID=2943436 RepID=UPI00244659F2|nr:aromatic-L-amino-acid decarboxylase-like [Paramacrobiotus metropolitanus]XP_055327316.1 aromatic-L-amino-acid decarboxylase-like [Paramacrobiotus metropolitanus]